MKFTAIFAAVMSVALFSADCFAQPPGRQRAANSGKPGAQNGERPQRGERGQRGPKGQGAEGQRQRPQAGQGQQRDPAELAARMMKEFDKDGDNKLNPQELVALLTSMRDRRMSADGAAGGGQRGGRGQRPEGAGKGGGPKAGGPKAGGKGSQRTSQAGTPGGQKPKRPTSN